MDKNGIGAEPQWPCPKKSFNTTAVPDINRLSVGHQHIKADWRTNPALREAWSHISAYDNGPSPVSGRH